MFTRTVSTDDLARLKREREDADREYNAALTALDRALLRLRDVPHPPTPYDEHQLRPLNEQWNLLAVRPIGTGWRGRFWSAVWSAVSPLFERQHAFNAALVEHLNRNTSVHREVATSAATTLTFMHEELIKTIEFTGFDYGMSSREVADAIVRGHVVVREACGVIRCHCD